MGSRKKQMADAIKAGKKQIAFASLITVLRHQEKCV